MEGYGVYTKIQKISNTQYLVFDILNLFKMPIDTMGGIDYDRLAEVDRMFTWDCYEAVVSIWRR